MPSAELQISAYARQHRSAVQELLFHSPWLHSTIEWQPIDQWLDAGRGAVFLAWQAQQLLGVLGLSRSCEGHSWLRLLCVHGDSEVQHIAAVLWAHASAHYQPKQLVSVRALMLMDWLGDMLPDLGFAYVGDIITLACDGCRMPAASSHPVHSVPVGFGDSALLAAIDQRAFPPPWRVEGRDLQQALRYAASARIALVEELPCAYHISLQQEQGMHLARLAVLPAYRRRGLARGLLRELLARVKAGGKPMITVNTQADNIPALRLYESCGFQATGESLAWWRSALV